MKTKRTKMLVTSIAMLLVALVALGSATYAWYSINRNVGANGFKVKASAPDGLQISEDGSTYGIDDLTLLNGGATLVPSDLTISGGAVTAGMTAEAANGDSYAASTSASITSGLDTYYITDDIYVKSQKDATVKMSVTALGTNVATSYVKMAVWDVTTSGSEAAVGSIVSNAATTKTQVGSDITLTANEAKQYRVFVWVDGTDSNCKTNTANLNDISFEIDFDLQGV